MDRKPAYRPTPYELRKQQQNASVERDNRTTRQNWLDRHVSAFIEHVSTMPGVSRIKPMQTLSAAV